MTDDELDAPMDLDIVRWEGSMRCAYLNNFRIAGGKPWAGGTTEKKFKGITIRELARAIPALRNELGLDYLGNRTASPTMDALAHMTDEQRVEIFMNYCMHCGRADPLCQCWNDE